MSSIPRTQGRGSSAVLTPAAIGTARPTDPAQPKSRKFRKMILPRKKIRAGGRLLDLASYYPSLIKAEKERAFDTIALQVSDRHTKDPRFTEGEVSNLAHEPDGPDGDGLYADIEFADDDGVKLVNKSKGKVGVSVSMVQNLEREEDGRKSAWPAALQHVLVTTDPEVRGMGGWHPIELGRLDVAETIDLSNQSYEEIEEEPMTAPTKTKTEESAEGTKPAGTPAEGTGESAAGDMVALEVTAEQRDQLLAFLADMQNLAGSGSGEEGAPAEDESLDPAEAGASTDLERSGDNDAIELMRGEIETERTARIELQRELQRAKAASEIESLGATGLAPSIIEKARPLLEVERGSGAIELSRDASGRTQNLDPTQVIRDVIQEVIELSRRGMGVISLDQEIGMHVGGEAEQNERAARLKAWNEQFPEG